MKNNMKKYQQNKKRGYNNHHLIGKCNRGYANVSDERNIFRIEIVKHNGLNALFQNLQSPHEQLKYMRNMFDKVLSETSKNLLDTLLAQPLGNFYADGIIKESKNPKKHQNKKERRIKRR